MDAPPRRQPILHRRTAEIKRQQVPPGAGVSLRLVNGATNATNGVLDRTYNRSVGVSLDS
jgi:hypothetical protein